MAQTIYDVAESERGVLLYYLNRMRDAVVRVSDGLTDEQAAEAGVPSGTSLLGLIRHLTGVEKLWFRTVFLGENPGDEVDMSMELPAGATREQLVADYREACARSDEIVHGCADLSTRAAIAIANPGESEPEPVTLRVILAHLIRETSRHAGHADILRERIDGATEL